MFDKIAKAAAAVLVLSSGTAWGDLPAEAPTPYPVVSDEGAWPGVGPIRVFDWFTHNRNHYWSLREQDKQALVFVGDSLTHGWQDLSAAFPGVKVANRGIGGDVTRGLLFRLQEDALDLDPPAVVLLIGGNDLSAHADPAGIAKNIGMMLDKIAAHNASTEVLLCTCTPRDSQSAPTVPGALEELNRLIRSLADDRPQVQLYDLNRRLSKPEGGPALEYFAEDRLHLGPAGYQAWADGIQEWVNEHGPPLAEANEAWGIEWIDPDTAAAAKRGYSVDESPTNEPTVARAPKDYRLAFSDEFNGSPDEDKWLHRYIYDDASLDHVNDDLGRRVDHTVSRKNGALTIRATPRGDGLWDTGVCRSKWTYRYGYLEGAVKFPANRGAWPSFWLNSGVEYPDGRFSKLGWPPEIDIFELVNNGREGPEGISSFVHGDKAKGAVLRSRLGADQNYRPGGSFADGKWRVFGCLWTPDRETTYVDGVEVVTREYRWVYNNGDEAVPAHILLDLAVGGKWAGAPEGEDPIELQFDYVRVYLPPSTDPSSVSK